MTDRTLWEDASLSHMRWSGNAQLDPRVTAPGLEEVVGLDPERWLAVGFEISAGEISRTLRVIAVPRDTLPEGGDVFPKLAAANGGVIPATEFEIHDVDPFEVLLAITHGFDMRLRHLGARDLPISVVSHGDVPEQQ